ncbi:TetR/AcrR family transcriptional regulator, partial [Streptomyces sp. NRRL WC-3742]|uniref:TetR/AcrR family transcriptional regulator n=1 Tax=Streptomyces sp. NRRL WC-3742 TaxID=1463934 RepID=UPI0004C97384
MNVRKAQPSPLAPRRPGQVERSAQSRSALMESAARSLSRYGYGNLVLAQVAADAGYSRGALYHQFKGKDELVLAALEWVLATWDREVGVLVEREPDPVGALLAMARGHAVFCRRDIARMALALRLEFSGQDHPVGRAVEAGYALLVADCEARIEAGRAAGAIPPGQPAHVLALAFVGALEGVVVSLAGRAPYDEVLAERAAAGVLGIRP